MSNHNQLIFPKERSYFEPVQSVFQLRRKIRQQKLLDKENSYRIIYLVNYAKCLLYANCRIKGCQAKFSYKRSDPQGKFWINLFINQHNHKQEPDQSKKNIQKQIIQEIHRMKSNGEKIQNKDMIKKFGCKKSFYYYVVSRNQRNQQYNFNCFLKKFKRQNGVYKCSPAKEIYDRSQYPDIFIGMRQEMRQNYEKYGQCIWIDTFNYFIQNKKEKNKKSVLLTFLFGLNCFRNLVIFGFAISKNQTKETMYRILRTYFMFHQKRETSAAFIFQSAQKQTGGVKEAFLELIEDNIIQCNVFVDKAVFIKEKQFLFNSPEKNKMLAEVSQAHNQEQFFEKMKQLKRLCDQNQRPIIDKIEKRKEKFCFSFFPKVFVHDPSIVSLNSKLSFLQRSKSRSKYYMQIIRKCFSAITQVNKESLSFSSQLATIKDPFGLGCLNSCRKSLSSPVFKSLLGQVGKSAQNIVLFDQSRKITNYVVKKLDSKIEYEIDGENYRCSCGFFEKTLLPCQHSISVLMLLNKNIFDYVGDFYKKEMQIVTMFLAQSEEDRFSQQRKDRLDYQIYVRKKQEKKSNLKLK